MVKTLKLYATLDRDYMADVAAMNGFEGEAARLLSHYTEVELVVQVDENGLVVRAATSAKPGGVPFIDKWVGKDDQPLAVMYDFGRHQCPVCGHIAPQEGGDDE